MTTAKSVWVNGRERLKRWAAILVPTTPTWASIAKSLSRGAWVVLLATAITIVSSAPALGSFLGVTLVAVGSFLVALVIWLVLALIFRAESKLRFAIVFLIIASLPAVGGSSEAGIGLLIGWILISLVFLGGGIGSARNAGWRWYNTAFTALGTLGILCFALALILPGWQVDEEIDWQAMAPGQVIDVPHPNTPGNHQVKPISYGPAPEGGRAGLDQAADFESLSVDGSKLLDGWESGSGWWRSKFFGIDATTLPIRGAGHMPLGPGPFPVVLIVHGNHLMEDLSDGGYEYLTQHFASRGMLAVSVDQNFLNSSLGDTLSLFEGGLEEENDARGWMLLKHLAQLRTWNQDVTHPLAGQLDLERVVLVGHSRGGEAVSEAAVFNTLSAYPDDATLAFDFNFGLRGIVAIAPVDHQYHPRNRDTQPHDLSYLVLHGSHDADVTSFSGAAQYARLSLGSCGDCFKAGIYLIGANHGQFNTSWGRRDFPLPMSASLNLAPIMPAQDQQDAAKALITSFLEATLHADKRYQTLLAAPHRLPGLLPEQTGFLSQFRAATDIVIADFEDDAEVTTGHSNATISSSNLTLWHETEVDLKWRDADTAAVAIGWHRADDGPDAQYSITIKDPLDITPTATLALTLAKLEDPPTDLDDYESPKELDFSIVLTDQQGESSGIALSQARPLLPAIEPSLYKLALLNSDPPSETVFQRYRFPLTAWQQTNPRFNPQSIARIELVFDQTQNGVILMDEAVISPTGM